MFDNLKKKSATTLIQIFVLGRWQSRTVLLTLLIILILQPQLSLGDDVLGSYVPTHKEVYARVANAFKSGDFIILQKYWKPQAGFSVKNVKNNWGHAQSVFQNIYPSYQSIELVATLAKNEDTYYWITVRPLNRNNTHVQSYEFKRTKSNHLGWKLSAGAHSGSYNHSASAALKKKTIADIRQRILSAEVLK